MKTVLVRTFCVSAGVLLLTTAVAKEISAFGSARILDIGDPIFSISYRFLFRGVGIVEVCLALICFLGKRLDIKAGAVAWLATCFFFYRISLLLIGYHQPCSCLGTLTDNLHISAGVAGNVMMAVLAYLLAGSYTALFLIWNKQIPKYHSSNASRAVC